MAEIYNYPDIYMGLKDGLAVPMIKTTTITIDDKGKATITALIECERREIGMTEVERWFQEQGIQPKVKGKVEVGKFLKGRVASEQRGDYYIIHESPKKEAG